MLRVALVLVVTLGVARGEPAPRVTVGVGGTLESVLAHSVDVAIAIRVSRSIYVNGSFAIVGKSRFFDDVEPVDGSFHAGQLGASYVYSRPIYALAGRGSLGYQRIRGRDYNWLFDDGHSFPITMDNVFLEVAGVARRRFGAHVFVELVAFVRMHRMTDDTAFIVARYAFHEGQLVFGVGHTVNLGVSF